MSELLVRPQDIFEIVKRQQKYILKAFAAGFSIVILAFLILPNTYQSETVLHIGVNYFQNPLISDLVSQTHDPNELRSERGRTVKSSLGVDFANKIGEKYKLFKTAPNDPARAVEVEGFLKRIDITDITATQYQIKVKAKTPEVADGIMRDTIEAIRRNMYVNRISTLEHLMAVLDSEIRTAGDDHAVRSGVPLAMVGASSDAAKAQLSVQIDLLQNRLQELSRAYNDQHPSVQGVRAEIAELKAVEKNGGVATGLTRRRVFSKGGSAAGMINIKDNLIKQKHLVNIALEMDRKDSSMSTYLSLIKEPIFPKSPMFPKLKLFLLLAFAVGAMAASAVAAVREFWQGSSLPPQELAKSLGSELLGTISVLTARTQR